VDRPTCETCPYWTDPDKNEFGECRVVAPTLTPAELAVRIYDDTNGMEYGAWPTTYFDSWCGQHPDFPAYIAARKAQPVDHPAE
jgi:hypothetical protein